MRTQANHDPASSPGSGSRAWAPPPETESMRRRTRETPPRPDSPEVAGDVIAQFAPGRLPGHLAGIHQAFLSLGGLICFNTLQLGTRKAHERCKSSSGHLWECRYSVPDIW